MPATRALSPCVVCAAARRTFRDDHPAHPMTLTQDLPVHRSCARELDRAAEAFPSAEIRDGALAWKSNGHHPFASDMTLLWVALGLVTVALADATELARAADTAAFITEYRQAQAEAGPVSAEEMFEMRAAFGPGQRVVNVLSGRTVTT